MFPPPQYSVFTQPVQLFVFVSFFCSYGVKIRGNYFKEKGHEKRKEWPRIILCISLCIQLMLFICYIFVNPQQIKSGCVSSSADVCFHQPAHLVKYI